MDHNFFIPAYGRWTTISLRPARRGGLCEKKEKKRIGRPVILRGKQQSRQAAKASGGQVDRFFFVHILGREVYPDVTK
jgi:hypothetical protein